MDNTTTLWIVVAVAAVAIVLIAAVRSSVWSHFVAPACLCSQMPTLRSIAVVAVSSLCVWSTASAQDTQSTERKTPVKDTRKKATANITVQHSESRPYDHSVTPALAELTLSETFSGDWKGDSTVRALQVLRDDKSATMASMQRFRGTLDGRRGTFVLQGSETISHGKISATWSVVSGSGTDELAGLRGEGGFEGEFGKGSIGTLDYWFER
jgi:uncharacterized protein DUF3224